MINPSKQGSLWEKSEILHMKIVLVRTIQHHFLDTVLVLGESKSKRTGIVLFEVNAKVAECDQLRAILFSSSGTFTGAESTND